MLFLPNLLWLPRNASIRFGGKVELIDEMGVVVAGERIAAKTVIWTAGNGASPAGKWLGTEMDKAGRVMVQSDLSVGGHPEIYVIGDTAHVESHGKLLPGVAQVAMQSGEFVGRQIAAKVEGKPRERVFHYHNKGDMATVGRSFAIGVIGKWRVSGLIGWVLWMGIHISYLVNFRSRIIVFIEWAWAYLTFERGVRLIISAEDNPLPEK